MGATPKQDELASRERKPRHDQLKAKALTSDELARARARNTWFDLPVVDETVTRLTRVGALLIVFSNLIQAAGHAYTSASTFDATQSLILANVAVGVVFFLLTFTAAIPRYWREIVVFVCTALLVTDTAIGAESMRVEPLFVSVIVIVVGVGMLAPWDRRWQAAISGIGMFCFYLLVRAHGVVDSDPSMHWLGLMTAVGLAQSNVYLQTKNRRELAQNLEDRWSTDRKLKESEEKFRQIFEQSGDIVVVTSLDTGRILEVNNQFVKRSRLPRELVVGRRTIDLNFWVEPAIRERGAKELRERGSVRNVEAQLIGVDRAQPTTALISAAVVRLNNQNCVINVVHEISDIREAERKARNSEATLRKIFDANLDAVTIADPVTRRFTDVNHEFSRATGFSREEVLGKTYWEIGVWRSREESDNFAATLGRTGEVRNMRANFYAKDGSLIPCLISGVILELDGKPSCMTITRDIGDLVAAEQKLKDSEAMLREIFDSSIDNISLTVLSDGVIIDVNNELVRSLGLAKNEIVGKTFMDLNVWVSTERLNLFVEALVKQREVRNFKAVFRAINGSTFPALISAVVLELGGRECVLSVTRDITDLEVARQKAEAASRAKTEFLSSMSHEIRTPMNAILGMADLMGESDLGSEQRRYLETIISNGNALLALINSILDLARVESGRLSLESVAFDVVELTEKVADTLAVRAHGKGIELAVRFGSGLPPMLVGDPLRLRQVLTNLIGNAIKFTTRGEIVIDVALNPAQPSPPSLLFSVRDTGVGIAPDALPNIFSAFTQADSSTTRKYGGSGLGLTIVERLVALMGGRVWVESELGAGSTFYFTAELGLPPAATNESEKREHRGLELSSVRALVVDDNATVRSIIAGMLSAGGAVVTEAGSGADGILAIDDANRNRAAFGLLLVDAQMPAMDDFEMIRRMRLGPNGNAPIVMLVTSNGLTTRLNAMRMLGVKHYVVKPVKGHELYAAISNAMADVATPAPAAVEPRPELAPNGSAAHLLDRPLSVLLADDSADNRLLVAAYLKKSRYVLDEVENGQAALDRFMTRAYDLVLMDIQMPVLDGYSAVRMIRQWETANQRRRTPIIALTASALEIDVRRALEVGCDLHVSKPVKKSTLLRAIEDVVKNSEHEDAVARPSPNDWPNGANI
jgi:PAS domain S-box-containing protein